MAAKLSIRQQFLFTYGFLLICTLTGPLCTDGYIGYKLYACLNISIIGAMNQRKKLMERIKPNKKKSSPKKKKNDKIKFGRSSKFYTNSKSTFECTLVLCTNPNFVEQRALKKPLLPIAPAIL